MSTWINFALPIGILGIFAVLVGSVYGIVVNTINADAMSKVKDAFTGIFTASTILIVAFALLSLYYITAVPSVFPKYFIIVSSFSLFLSLLSVSYSVLWKTS